MRKIEKKKNLLKVNSLCESRYLLNEYDNLKTNEVVSDDLKGSKFILDNEIEVHPDEVYITNNTLVVSVDGEIFRVISSNNPNVFVLKPYLA